MTEIIGPDAVELLKPDFPPKKPRRRMSSLQTAQV